MSRVGLHSSAPAPVAALRDAFMASVESELLWTACIVATAAVLGWLAARGALAVIARGVGRTKVELDDIVVRHTRAPLSLLLPIVVVRWALPWSGLAPDAADELQQPMLALAVMAAGWALLRLTHAGEEFVTRQFDVSAADNLQARTVHTQVRALRNVARFVIVVFTLGAMLMTFSDVRAVGAGLLASTGVLGIVLGFAAQRSIATVLSGIHIALAQPIRVDDVLIVEGEWGRVEEITLTYVVIKIWDERRLIVPISYFVEKPFQNWTRVSSELLGTVELHLDYSVPLSELRNELKRIVQASPHWDGRVCNIQVTGTSERAMLVRPLISAKNASAQWELRCEVREKLITFIQQGYPHALPTLRASVRGADSELAPRGEVAG